MGQRRVLLEARRAGSPRAACRATCDDDRSIIDPRTRLPCALAGAPLDQLMNADDNLRAADVVVKAK
jgi:hypothetical protein